jgi:hypothetical protein
MFRCSVLAYDSIVVGGGERRAGSSKTRSNDEMLFLAEYPVLPSCGTGTGKPMPSFWELMLDHSNHSLIMVWFQRKYWIVLLWIEDEHFEPAFACYSSLSTSLSPSLPGKRCIG